MLFLSRCSWAETCAVRNLLVYPTYAFYPTYISVVNLLQSLHFGGLLNHEKRRYFWIVFAAIFCWEW